MELSTQIPEMLEGTEVFTSDGQSLGFTVKDFWQFQYSNIYDMQEYIAEFLVARALGLKVPFNRNGWTLWDLEYQGWKIEVKETGYFHSWRADGKTSEHRFFGITKAYSEYQNPDSELKRQSDIYVFCLNIGNSKEESNPLKMENWEFYVVPTNLIDEVCRDNKSIGLSRVRKLSEKVSFENLQSAVESAISKIG